MGQGETHACVADRNQALASQQAVSPGLWSLDSGPAASPPSDVDPSWDHVSACAWRVDDRPKEYIVVVYITPITPDNARWVTVVMQSAQDGTVVKYEGGE